MKVRVIIGLASAGAVVGLAVLGPMSPPPDPAHSPRDVVAQPDAMEPDHGPHAEPMRSGLAWPGTPNAAHVASATMVNVVVAGRQEETQAGSTPDRSALVMTLLLATGCGTVWLQCGCCTSGPAAPLTASAANRSVRFISAAYRPIIMLGVPAAEPIMIRPTDIVRLTSYTVATGLQCEDQIRPSRRSVPAVVRQDRSDSSRVPSPCRRSPLQPSGTAS